MRLIDADELKKAFEDTVCIEPIPFAFVKQIIDNAPTVDKTCPNCNSGYAQGYSDGYLQGKEERPTVDLERTIDEAFSNGYRAGTLDAISDSEQPKGKWIPVPIDTDMGIVEGYKCDRCDVSRVFSSKYCPNCGARMEGETE